MKTRSLLVAVVAAIAGCGATIPVPADKLARSQAAVQSAEEVDATRDPRAAVHLRLAKEQLERGKALMRAGESKQASLVLLRAEADGEAALNLARAHSARMDAEKTIEQVRQAMTRTQEGRGS